MIIEIPSHLEDLPCLNESTGDGTVRRPLVDGDLPFPKEMSEYNVYFPPLGRNELFFLIVYF